MKNWKKLLALLLALVMCLALAACGGESEAEEDASGDTSAAAEGDASGEAADADVQAIIDRGVLRVGVKSDVLGFGYLDPTTNEYSGIEIDLAQALADKLGVEVEYTTVTAATRGELLDSGDLDCVLATFTITEERRQSWDFTTAYYTDHVTALVETESGITSLEDLVGATVGVSSSSTSARALVEAMIEAGVITGEGFDAETFDPALWTEGVSFRQYDDYPAISTALSAGEVQAFCVDRSILAYYQSADRSFIDAEFAPQEYGIVTRLGSGFSAYCEEFVQACLSDGTIEGLMAEYNLG